MDGDRPLTLSVQPVRYVFFEHCVEVGSAETEGTEAGSPHTICGDSPRLQFGVYVEWGMSEVNVRVRMLAVHARRQDLVAERQCGLQQSRRTSRSFEMSEIRFH